MVSFRPRPLPISQDEFARMFQAVIPPTGWSTNIGVANSGGPDSTCLLFLMRRHLASLQKQTAPKRLFSFNVDHALQSCSAEMSRKCAQMAENVGVEHASIRIPWSKDPYPPLPDPGLPIETLARKARYHALLQLMQHYKTHIIAFGHHADDQMETTLIRMGRGTTLLGARGIWPCRRWGMGIGSPEGNSLGWAGMAGMNRWIVRPLLPVTKDRVLATCEENGLEYVTDPTNFQPDLTIRNALRQRIDAQDENMSAENSAKLPPDLRQELDDIQKALHSVSSVPVTLDSGKGQIQSALRQLMEDADDIDTKGKLSFHAGPFDSILKRCKVASPDSTFLISYRAIADIDDPLIRRALILRILRYVSFFPWGSLRADANRRGHSLEQIIQKLWDPRPLTVPRPRFVAGGGVIWAPVVYDVAGKIREFSMQAGGTVDPNSSFGWIAGRQPPFNKRNPNHRHLVDQTRADPTQDIIRLLKRRHAGLESFSKFEYLWDCRFLITFDLEKMPEEIKDDILRSRGKKIQILPFTRWQQPIIVLWDHGSKEVLYMPEEQHKVPLDKILAMLKRDGDRQDPTIAMTKGPSSHSDWVTAKFIRSLDSA